LWGAHAPSRAVSSAPAGNIGDGGPPQGVRRGRRTRQPGAAVLPVHSGRILFWTNGGRAQALAVRQHPDSLGLAHFRLARWDERRAKIILRWTFGAFGV
jgi:hypothetical protein